MKYSLIFAIIFSLTTGEAIACSFAPGYFPFEPSPKGFETRMEGGSIALLPPPEVRVDKVVRGSASPGSSCGDAGMIHLTVIWPEDSVYELNEIGFYFQSENGLEPDLIFSLGPVTGEIQGNEAKFYFVWLDGHPKYQKALNFKVNVFAVNKGFQIGQPTIIKIKAKEG